MPTRNTKEGDFIKANFASIWPVHLAGFTRLLAQLRRHLDGDLDMLLIMAVIGDRTRPDRWSPELSTYRQLTRDSDEPHHQHPINIQSVADYSGIPRETVRRKIRVLEEKGWITRDAQGHLAISASAAPDLAEATGDSIAYLARILIAFEEARKPGD
ncbi:hypothetical protein [Thetidibacter halocola]|uniref:HTH crp-type domain-containing protein n=1 Tax=Thetidibacter halocola TaxID=2827239 RepID=A0A8J7WG26_9RHOB|nr:hypothetical protein [Thetidibacter halocola]MBS0124494.1 hypothetical protein [Thetidibacter halocola]